MNAIKFVTSIKRTPTMC